MNRGLLTVAVRCEQDVVVARQRARQIAALLGFDGKELLGRVANVIDAAGLPAAILRPPGPSP